jgi:hypothetical protein
LTYLQVLPDSTIKLENRSEKISKKPKIGVCNLFSNLDNILKVLMYPLEAFSFLDILEGGQDRIFKKVLLFAHAVVTGLSPPPLKRVAIFLEISPPGVNILAIAPPVRIFAPHICDAVYSNNFVIRSSY